MRRILGVFVFIFLMMPSYCQEYNFIEYGVSKGLPQSQVNDIVQDDQRYIWAATQGGGVARFDGQFFETFNSIDGLPSNFVNCLLPDDYRIWIGTSNGFCRIRNGGVDLIRKLDLEVFDIVKYDASSLWLGTDKGIYLFDIQNATLTKVKLGNELDSSRVNKIVIDDGVIWLATNSGLFKHENAQTSRLIFAESDTNIKDIAIHEELVLLACHGVGPIVLNKLTNSVLKDYFSIKASLSLITKLFVLDEELWVGTEDNGLAVYNWKMKLWRHIDESIGLPYNHVSSIESDHSGNLWVGTAGSGMGKYVGQNFKYLREADGLNGSRVYSVLSDQNDMIWMSINDSGISVLNKDQLQLDIDGNLITTKCTDIYQDYEGRMWFSTEGQGVFKLDSSGYTSFTRETGLVSNYISSCLMDNDSVLWVASAEKGISKIYKNDRIVSQYPRCLDDRNTLLTTLAKDPDGNIWYGTNEGLVGKFSEDVEQCYGIESGLPKVPIVSIAFDKLENVWLGTLGSGIYKGSIRNGVYLFEQIEENFSLLGQNINFLIFDNSMNLWAGSNLGIDKLSMNASGYINSITPYGRNNGFTGVETCHNAVSIDSEGNLVIGTLNGMARLFEQGRSRGAVSPVLNFSDTYIEQQPISSTEYGAGVGNDGRLKNDVEISYGERNIRFSFKGVDLDFPERVTYSWRLSPGDTLWSRYTESTSVNFSSLPPGEYSFQVRAKNRVGKESRVIEQNFSIETPIWKRGWFYSLCTGGLALLFYSFYRNRIRRIRKVGAAKLTDLKLRNEILELEQKALQLQMNPHFIFNALNSIQGLVVREKTDEARMQMQTFASLMRGLLQNSKQSKISLQDEYDTLDKYLSMEQFCQANKFEYSITLPNDVNAEEIEIPPMMIQPFVENSIIHGIAHKTSAGKIIVKFFVKGQLLYCSIRDNGVGREKARAISLKSQKKHESSALNITKKRLEALRRERNYECFSIEDILLQDEVAGTEVLIAMPLEINY